MRKAPGPSLITTQKPKASCKDRRTLSTFPGLGFALSQGGPRADSSSQVLPVTS